MGRMVSKDQARRLTINSIKPAAPKPKIRWGVKKRAVLSEQSSGDDLHSLCNMDVFKKRY